MRNNDVFEVEICAALRNKPQRFEKAYDFALRQILQKVH
jgi:hypothetical protein